MKIIGLTGGIASGKSTVVNIIKEMNDPFITIIDLDSINRNLLKDNLFILMKIAEYFGVKAFIDNEFKVVNKKYLKERMFNNKEDKRFLNNLLHPFIKAVALKEIEEAKTNNYKICLVDAPLLFESGFDIFMFETWVVYTSEVEQVNRIIKRDNLSLELCEKIIQSQMSTNRKLLMADVAIDNNETLEILKEQVYKLIKERLE